MADTPFSLIDLAGVVRFKGTARPPIGGGGAPLSGAYTGEEATIADGATGPITWDTFAGGDDVLDLTNPVFPTAKVAGLYIVAATVYAYGPLTPGGSFRAIVNMLGLADNQGVQDSPAASVALPQPVVTVTVADVFDVGSAIELDVRNSDGASARDFAINRAAVVVIPST